MIVKEQNCATRSIHETHETWKLPHALVRMVDGRRGKRREGLAGHEAPLIETLRTS